MCIYLWRGKGKWGKCFFREKSIFFEGGDGKLNGLCSGAEAGRFSEAEGRFRGCCTDGKKCVNLQVIAPGRFGCAKWHM